MEFLVEDCLWTPPPNSVHFIKRNEAFSLPFIKGIWKISAYTSSACDMKRKDTTFRSGSSNGFMALEKPSASNKCICADTDVKLVKPFVESYVSWDTQHRKDACRKTACSTSWHKDQEAGIAEITWRQEALQVILKRSTFSSLACKTITIQTPSDCSVLTIWLLYPKSCCTLPHVYDAQSHCHLPLEQRLSCVMYPSPERIPQGRTCLTFAGPSPSQRSLPAAHFCTGTWPVPDQIPIYTFQSERCQLVQ